MKKTKSILIVGVGGQGTILSSKMLTLGLMEKGYDVKMSEIHGMSQRGGSVSAHIKYGDKVNSPVIGLGEADVLISFEQMETYRWLKYVSPNGKVVTNSFKLPSAPILSGIVEYPEGLIEEIKSKADTTVIDAMDIVNRLNTPRSMNMVMLGALISVAKLNDINWKGIMESLMHEKYIDINMKALHIGMEQIG